jgi:threonine/homoserine/homoserine lactone efflux protein
MEQGLLFFLASAVMISLSGVLSPGPMTAAVIQHGGRSRLTGVYVSLGHGVVEVPLIILLALGAGSLFETPGVRIFVGLAGGAYLLHMGKGLLRPGDLSPEGQAGSSSLMAGIALSIGNPYFLLWWATVGLGLVLSAVKFGALGLVLFIAIHWLCDLIWYTLLSSLSYRGVKTFGSGLYRKVSIACGLAMLFFGGGFIVSSLKLLAA